MIINFSVENFSSIKDKVTLSFEADKSKHLEDYFIITTKSGMRLLKLGLIFGANAAGKTSVISALDFLRNLVLSSATNKTDKIDVHPYKFDSETPNLPTKFSIDFIQNEVKYSYLVEFNRIAVLKEELYSFNPNKSIVFKRATDLEKEFTKITFGSKISINKSTEDTLISNTLWNNSVLGGFLKTNIKQKELQDTTKWFYEYLKPIVLSTTSLDQYVTDQIYSSEIEKKDVISILKKADFHISDIFIKKVEGEIPDDLFNFLEHAIPDELKKNEKIKKDRKYSINKVDVEHTVNNVKYTLPFDWESQGTQRYYGFAGLLSLLIRKKSVIPIDEIEASLHPDLFIHFILTFLINAKSSQLIATTHNREILNNKDIFRNDSIWFVNKNESCSTELYSLADFDTSVIRDTTNIYNAYKIGKLGGVPNLGDYYINLNNEE